eukprot:scaffold432563_cov29-Prasinocladus_malaysianus.AAC.1
MSSRPLSRCGLSDDTLRRLQARRISTGAEVLTRTVLELSEELDVSPQEARGLQAAVARAICPEPRTAAELCAA